MWLYFQTASCDIYNNEVQNKQQWKMNEPQLAIAFPFSSAILLASVQK